MYIYFLSRKSFQLENFRKENTRKILHTVNVHSLIDKLNDFGKQSICSFNCDEYLQKRKNTLY